VIRCSPKHGVGNNLVPREALRKMPEIVPDTNGTYLSEKLQFPSFLRKQESSDFRLSEALDPRFRGDDELKSVPFVPDTFFS
jgi:hypothetical protein